MVTFELFSYHLIDENNTYMGWLSRAYIGKKTTLVVLMHLDNKKKST